MNLISLTVSRITCILALVIANIFFVNTAVAQEQEMSDLPPYASLSDGSVNKDDVPELEAMWSFFNMVVEVERKSYGSGRSMLQHSTGIDQSDVDLVFDYIQSAIDDIRLVNKNAHDEACSRKTSLTDRALIASEMREIDRVNDTERSMKIIGLSEVLDPNREVQLRQWVDKNIRSNIKMVSVDYDAYLYDQDIDPEALVAKMCDTKPKMN